MSHVWELREDDENGQYLQKLNWTSPKSMTIEEAVVYLNNLEITTTDLDFRLKLSQQQTKQYADEINRQIRLKTELEQKIVYLERAIDLIKIYSNKDCKQMVSDHLKGAKNDNGQS